MGPSGGVDDDLHPELTAAIDGFTQMDAAFSEFIQKRTQDQLGWSPDGKAWSIAQVVEHLNKTAEAYLPALEQAIDRGHTRGKTGSGATRHGLVARWFLRTISPDGKSKVTAPPLFRPTTTPVNEDLLPRFQECQRRFIAAARQASGLDLTRNKVSSPALKIIRFPMGTWFQAMVFHEQRHLKQAERLLTLPGFPGGQ